MMYPGGFLQQYADIQRLWSLVTFGPDRRTVGLAKHIQKELLEIQADPDDVREWIDVIILAIDGYWRHGGRPEELAQMLQEKQRINIDRAWPAPLPEDQPTEHLR